MRYIGIILLLFLTSSLFAQDPLRHDTEIQTLFGGQKGIGGYIGLNSKLTNINNEEAFFTGGEISVVVSRSVNLGFEGYGMLTPVLSNRLTDTGDSLFLQMGYGGIHIEPVISSSKVIHLTFPILLGFGGTAYSTQHYWFEDPNGDIAVDFDPELQNARGFLIAEPGANLELNLLKWMRIGAGLSYRLIHKLNSNDPATEELEGLSMGLSLRFGLF